MSRPIREHSLAAKDKFERIFDPQTGIPSQDLVKKFLEEFGQEKYDKLKAGIKDERKLDRLNKVEVSVRDEEVVAAYSQLAREGTKKGRIATPKLVQDMHDLYEIIVSTTEGQITFATAQGVYIDIRDRGIRHLYIVIQVYPDHIVMRKDGVPPAESTLIINPGGVAALPNGTVIADQFFQHLIKVPPKLYRNLSRLRPVPPIALAPRFSPTLPEMPMNVVGGEGGIMKWNRRTELRAYAIQSDNEYVTYVRHLAFTTGFSNEAIDATPLPAADLDGGIRKVPGFETLRKVLLYCQRTPAQRPIWNRYITYSFIRNVIDFLHDYVHEGVKLWGALLDLGPSIDGFDGGLFSIWQPQIQTAITAGGKVNQTTCKVLSAQVAVECKRWLKGNMPDDLRGVLDWLIVDKDQALVATANKADPAAIAAMLQKASDNGCTGLYIESLGTSAKKLFSQIPTDTDAAGNPVPRIKYIDVLSGRWDAGSGISIGEARAARSGLQELILARWPAGVAGTQQIPRTVNLGGQNANPASRQAEVVGDSSVGGFGLFPIGIDESGVGAIATTVYAPTAAAPGLTLQINGRQRLSVNGLLASVGLPGVRGSGEAAGGAVAFALPAGFDHRTADTRTKLAALCLKQWTDTIQTDDVVNGEAYDAYGNSQGHTAVAYFDVDAEEYCAMIGGTSIMQRGREFFYYCYDATKRSIPAAELARKRRTMVWAQANVAGIAGYVDCWHRNAIAALNFILTDTEDPCVFFATVATLNKLYENHANVVTDISNNIILKNPDNLTDVTLYPSTGSDLLALLTNNMSIVATFDETYSNLTRVFSAISQIRAARLNPDIFNSAFESIQQQIINALPNMGGEGGGDVLPIYDRITILFFAYGFLLPFDEIFYSTPTAEDAGEENKRRTIDNVIVTLESCMKSRSATPELTDKLNRLIEELNELRSEDLALDPFLKLWEDDPRQFVPLFDGDFVGCGAAGVPAIFPQPPPPPPAGGHAGGRRRRRTIRRRARKNRTRKN